MTSSQTSIRPATPEDASTIAELASAIWRQHYPGIITHEQIDFMLARGYEPTLLIDEITRQGIRYDLCVTDAGPVGFVAYGPGPEEGELKVHKLYLRSEFQGRGLGRALLERALTHAADAGYANVILAVNKNNTGSISMYGRCGFTVRASVVVDIGGGFVMDDYIMARPVI